MRLQRRMKHTHQVSVALLVPHSSFTPVPTMSPLEIAYQKGREAARRGRPVDDNPHQPGQDGLSTEWMRGYNG